MKQKILFVVLWVGFCMLINVNARALDLDADGKKAYTTLQSAPYFAIGGVGYAGIISEREKAMRVLIKQKHGIEAFQAIVKEGKMEGRLYALLGLKLLDKNAFQKALNPFLISKATATIMRGCIQSERPVSDIAKDIEKGVYH